MYTLEALEDIALRLDHLESAGEWISQASAELDPSVSQTGALIATLAEDVRNRLLELVSELEKELVVANRALAN